MSPGKQPYRPQPKGASWQGEYLQPSFPNIYRQSLGVSEAGTCVFRNREGHTSNKPAKLGDR